MQPGLRAWRTFKAPFLDFGCPFLSGWAHTASIMFKRWACLSLSFLLPFLHWDHFWWNPRNLILFIWKLHAPPSMHQVISGDTSVDTRWISWRAKCTSQVFAKFFSFLKAWPSGHLRYCSNSFCVPLVWFPQLFCTSGSDMPTLLLADLWESAYWLFLCLSNCYVLFLKNKTNWNKLSFLTGYWYQSG